MRTVGVMATLAMLGTGCLYVGSVNNAPTAALEIDPKVMSDHLTLIKGQPLHLIAHMRDSEDGYNLKPHWQIKPADQQSYIPDDNCDAQLLEDPTSTSPDPGSATATVTIFRTGNWVVTFYSTDQLGAHSSSTASVMIPVVDSPPRFSKATEQLHPHIGLALQCTSYVAGQPLPLTLDGQDNHPPVLDDDALAIPNGCTALNYLETISYTWKILAAPASSHVVIGPKPSSDPTKALGDAPCPATPPPGLGLTWKPTSADYPFAACVYPDVGGANPFMYQIAVTVSDGTSEIRTDTFQAAVRADLPPCMTGASPQAGSYVVDRAQPQEFLITGTVDDLDPFPSAQLGFVWSLWRESDPTWREVPSYALPSFTLDASGFHVGEKVRVRAEAVDRTKQRRACNIDQDSCVVADSCALGPGAICQGWITWDLELR